MATIGNPFSKALGTASAGKKKNPALAKAKAAEQAAKERASEAAARAKTAIARAAEESKASTARALARARAGAHTALARSKEPLMSVVSNEGVRTGSHIAGYWADALIPIRGSKAAGPLNILGRPSMALAIGSFATAAFTKGPMSFYAREIGQGFWHHVVAVTNRQIHNWIFTDPSAYDGMAGTGAPSETVDGTSTEF